MDDPLGRRLDGRVAPLALAVPADEEVPHVGIEADDLVVALARLDAAILGAVIASVGDARRERAPGQDLVADRLLIAVLLQDGALAAG